MDSLITCRSACTRGGRSEFFFVPNKIDRYDLGGRNRLITNPDGSVDLYLGAGSPGADKEAN
jgi:hypothetical protein